MIKNHVYEKLSLQTDVKPGFIEYKTNPNLDNIWEYFKFFWTMYFIKFQLTYKQKYFRNYANQYSAFYS